MTYANGKHIIMVAGEVAVAPKPLESRPYDGCLARTPMYGGVSMKTTSLENRLWPKIDKRGPNECWPWTKSRDHYGYGRICKDGSHQPAILKAHRVAWAAINGPIPSGMCILHACDNPCCCNPNHLWLGTHADNVADRGMKGRQAKGERIGSSKLTREDVRKIRSDPRSQRVLGRLYDIDQSQICRVKNGEWWGWLT